MTTDILQWLALLSGVAFIIIGVWGLSDIRTELKECEYWPLKLNLFNNMLREVATLFLVIALFKYGFYLSSTMEDFLYPIVAYGLFHVVDLVICAVGKTDHWRFERNERRKKEEIE